MRVNYAAPVQWFTTGNPARVVIEVQRLFEEAQTDSLSGGIAFTKIRKGTDHGPAKNATTDEREAAIKKWRAWWEKQEKR